jgi:putative ABC transport system substrate-binding protein
MDRRVFLGTVAGSVLRGVPMHAYAQQPGKVYRIGAIFDIPPLRPEGQGWFYDRMRELGWVYGQSFLLERRIFGDQYEQIPDLAAELIRWGADVLYVPGTRSVALVQQVTHTIPIVSVAASDLVAAGFAASAARPGGNVTGVQTQTIGVGGKHLSLLKEVIPRLSRVALLNSTENPQLNVLYVREAEAAAKALNIQLRIVAIQRAEEFEAAFAASRHERAQAIILGRSAFLTTYIKPVTALALKHRLPTISDLPQLVTEGGLMAYGVSWAEMFRSAADIIDKIFRGAKAGEIPILQPTTFSLAINLKTAKALGLTIPQSLLQRADQVIE